jgi:hypothetical protein
LPVLPVGRHPAVQRVEKRIYEGMGHGVNADEREYVDGMVAELLA